MKKLVKKIGKAIGSALDSIANGIKSGLIKIGRAFAETPGLSAVIVGFACGVGGPGGCVLAGKIMMGLNAAITLANGGTIDQALTGIAVGLVTSGVPGLDGMIGGGLTGVVGDAIGSNFAAAMFMGGVVAKASGQKFIDGVKGAAVGAAIGYGISRILSAVAPPAEAVTVSESNGGQLDSKTYTEEQWELAKQNVSQARDMVVADIRSGDLDISLVEDQVLGGFDKGIKLKVVASIDGANADVTFSSDQSIAGRAMGRVMDVKINIAVGRAQTLGGAIESFTHELRHLSPVNRAMNGPAPGVSVYYGEQESDARRTGGAVRRAYGY
ncbi:hypothetical protein [Zhongshania marina]|uniref:hypothetical protein n=1 Tax=Zhongshania marina TaxID=2304603 RepID=UPI001E398B7E|nr:hypothetical protein [Marortus luteolus]